VWEGFIFINLDENPSQSLREFLGEMGEGLEGYPYHKFTQVYGYRAVVNANWKEFSDSFSETYHAPYLHGGMSTEMADGIATADATLFKIMAPHGMASWREFPRELEQPTPIEKVVRAGLFGPWDQADLGLAELPKGINELRDDQWGIDSNQIFPNLVILFWERGWYMTYHYWPLSVDSHLFECYQYFMPPKNATERLQQELSVAMSREYAFQDANTLEATHSMLKTRVKTKFPMCDQEILPRNLHYRVVKAVEDWEARHEPMRAQAAK
jgi:phenylpropionate dioxygenase-like ring-hydroxylating dioxygenase large terminal subunit